MTLSDADLRALLDLEAKATPGPWGDDSGTETGDWVTLASDHRTLIAEAGWQGAGDAKFIAAARNAVRPLVEECRRWREFFTTDCRFRSDITCPACKMISGVLTKKCWTHEEEERLRDEVECHSKNHDTALDQCDRYRDALAEAVGLLRRMRQEWQPSGGVVAAYAEVDAFLAKHAEPPA